MYKGRLSGEPRVDIDTGRTALIPACSEASCKWANVDQCATLEIICTNRQVVNVKLVEFDVRVVRRVRMLLKHGRNKPAWATPCRPKVYNDDFSAIDLGN